MAPKIRERRRSRSPLREAPETVRSRRFELPEDFINLLELTIAQEIEKKPKDIIIKIEVDLNLFWDQADLHVAINGEEKDARGVLRDEMQHFLCSSVSKATFDVIEHITTRWGIYEMVSSPAFTDQVPNRVIAAFSRTNCQMVQPLRCAPWSLKARIHELEPKAKELEMLRAKLQRMQALYGVPNCFLANTAFRTFEGTFKAVQDFEVGDAIRLGEGKTAHITHATRLRQGMQDVIELVTAQASLRVSANHRIVTDQGPRFARDLKLNDKVCVGERMRPLASARRFQEGVDLFDIRFTPDAPIEAYVIPNYGIQVHAAGAPPLMEVFQNIPHDELMRAMPETYEE